MQCVHAQEFFSEYVSGQMDPALALSLEQHLAGCGDCTTSVEGLRQVWLTLDSMSIVDPPENLHASIMNRISSEQIREERAAVRLPSWRSLVQPRAFAYAAAAMVLLVGAEFVQVQRASLGPIGLLLNVIHPSPVMQTQQAEWKSNGLGGGTIILHLRAHEQSNGAARKSHARIELVRSQHGAQPPAKVIDVTSAAETVTSIPVDFVPDLNSDNVEVTVTPTGSNEESVTISLPLTPAK